MNQRGERIEKKTNRAGGKAQQEKKKGPGSLLNPRGQTSGGKKKTQVCTSRRVPYKTQRLGGGHVRAEKERKGLAIKMGIGGTRHFGGKGEGKKTMKKAFAERDEWKGGEKKGGRGGKREGVLEEIITKPLTRAEKRNERG